MDNLDELRKLTNKLSNIENDLTLFFNEIPVLFFVAEKSGAFTKVNPAFTTQLGWSEKEMLSKNWIEFVHPDDVIRAEKASVIGDEKPLNGFISRFITKSGKYVKLKWYASTWVNGKNYGVAIVVD